MNRKPTQHNNAELLGALFAKPGPLAQAADQAMIEVMTALAAGELTGEELALARQLKDEDPEAAAYYGRLLAAQPAARTTAPAAAVKEFFDGLTLFFREFYVGLAKPAMFGSPGDEPVQKKTIPVGRATATISHIKRPDGFYEVELVVPAAAGVDPAELAGYGLKVVDRPDPLTFKKRRSGDLVATVVLSPLANVPEKSVVIVPVPKEI